MKSRFGFTFRNDPTPPHSSSDFAEVSPVSEFSDVTLLSPSSSALNQEKIIPNRPINPFYNGKKPPFPNFIDDSPCFDSSLPKLSDFLEDPLRLSHFGSPLKQKPSIFDRPSLSTTISSPQFPNSFSRYSPSSNLNSNPISSLISIPMPPLINTSIFSPKPDSPGPSEASHPGKFPSSRFKTSKNKKPKRKPGWKGGIEMAVFDACPGRRLSEEQVQLLEAELVKALDSIEDGEKQPTFLKSFFDQGVFWMICADESTKFWLIRHVRQLNHLWDGRHLKVVEAEIPKRPILYIDLPDLDKPTDVLARLSRQNAGLNTDRWVVLNKILGRGGQRITFSTDLDSFEYLKTRKFQLSWKLRTISLRVPNKGATKGVPVKPVRSRPPKPQFYRHF